MIFEPPEAPIVKTVCPVEFKMIVGDIDDIGLFPGLIKFFADGASPKEFETPGVEKSSMESL